jgi:thiamine-phosphate pyrophosphorylase
VYRGAASDRSYHRRMDRLGRVIDANLNRASEGLRVLEDAARFGLESASLCGRLKSMRHRLRVAVAAVPAERLRRGRDAEGDPGRGITVPTESVRADWPAVAAAAGGRLAEALRSIEELLKVQGVAADATAASEVERLRYESYAIAAEVERGLVAMQPRQWRLCLLLTEDLCTLPWPQVLAEAIAGGADAVQIREKGLADAALLERVRRAIGIARPAGAAVVVNDRVDLALAAGADGVHLGQEDLPVSKARAIAGGELLIGASTHSLEEAEAAIAQGADGLGVGSMFATALKPSLEPTGLAFLQAFLARHPGVPHLAIGGISPANAAAVAAAGGRGVAVSSAICGASDPRGVAERLCEAIGGGTHRA